MNPSTQDFVEAINQLMTDEVLILPNNGNVILAAQQAVKIASKPTEVVHTKTIPQGIAALMAYNPENDLLINQTKMEEASNQIITLEITYSVRDAQYDGHNIKKGQILGLGEGKLVVTGNEIKDVVEKTIDHFLEKEHELITLYYGEDVKEEEAEKLVEALSQKYPDVDFELHYGGQPLYYYLVSIE
jgi:dihydroxyacetone kinase-like predicted kinase